MKSLKFTNESQTHALKCSFHHKNDIGYLTSGFEYFPVGFAQAADQTKHKVDQHTTRRALFDALISFLK